MILQLIWKKKYGYVFQLMEDLGYHPLKEATVDDIKEYKEYLDDQLRMVNDILR